MLKKGYALSMLCLLILFLGCNLANPLRLQTEVMYIQQSPVIDGMASEWEQIKEKSSPITFYKGDNKLGSNEKLGTTICKKIDDQNDCRVDLWIVHDGQFLYILAEVKDDSYEPFDAANENNEAYKEDTLHLYVDSTNACAADIKSSPISNQVGYQQFGISTDGNIWGENTDFNNNGPARKPAPKGSDPDGKYWQAKCQVKKLDEGFLYVFEERIALSGWPGRNMKPMRPGISYGFNAEFCDADNGDTLQGFIFWSSDGQTDAWNHQNLWGKINLAPVIKNKPTTD